MINKKLFSFLFVVAGLPNLIMCMELESTKEQDKNEHFGLVIKNDGSGVIKQYTIDYQKGKSSIVQKSPSNHYLVNTIPIQYKKIKKINNVNFTILGPLLDSGKKFYLETQSNHENKKRYIIDQVTVKSWPILWDEIKNKKYDSVSKYLTSDSVVYDLDNTQSTDLLVLNCSPVIEIQEKPTNDMPETLSSIALVAFILYSYRNNLMVFSFFSRS